MPGARNSSPKPPLPKHMLYCGDIKWVPVDDDDKVCLCGEKVLYVTKEYFDEKIKKGNSRDKGRWVCIVEYFPRYCQFCRARGNHTSNNCPNKAADAVGYELICQICMENGHRADTCPFFYYVPLGAKVSDAAIVENVSCRVLPEGDFIRVAGIKMCRVCGTTGDHDLIECPKRDKPSTSAHR